MRQSLLRRLAPVGLILALAQPSHATPALQEAPLPPGARLFQQYCGVCHIGARAGPPVARSLIAGREGDIRKTIMDGSGGMPGFRFTLSGPQVDEILEYLKGLEKPPTLITVPRVEP